VREPVLISIVTAGREIDQIVVDLHLHAVNFLQGTYPGEHIDDDGAWST
jgi:hypothetical protein